MNVHESENLLRKKIVNSCLMGGYGGGSRFPRFKSTTSVSILSDFLYKNYTKKSLG
jgi:hypothetical protein